MITIYGIPVLFASLLTISNAFNPLFKVLFIFPSRYLFAIGLSPIFSFRSDLPPRNKSLELQSQTTRLERSTDDWRRTAYRMNKQTGFSPSLTPHSRRLTFGWTTATIHLKATIRALTTLDFKSELIPLRSPLLRNRCCFLFLRLLICLNSAGNLTWFEVALLKIKVFWLLSLSFFHKRRENYL